MKKTIYLLIGTILSSSVPLFAQDLVFEQGVGLKKLGQSTMNFLQVSIVPRAAALGEAFTVIGKGPEAIFYNPAGMAEMNGRFGVFVSGTKWIADIQYLGGAAAWKLSNVGVVGLSFMTVDYGEMYGTSLISKSAASTNPLGYIDNGVFTNTGAFAFGLGFARTVSSLFSIGGNVRYVSQQLGQSITTDTNGELKDNDAQKLSFDLGVKYNTGFKSFSFGMSIRNFATSVKYEELTAQLPMTFAVGASMDMLDWFMKEHQDHSALLLLEFSHPNNYTERLHAGLEYAFMGRLFLRGGYVTNSDIADWSIGMGVNQALMGKNLELSYSYSHMQVFDNVSRISIGVTL
ncbi:MAG TPA: PorV/PorQ family protein [bacterium]